MRAIQIPFLFFCLSIIFLGCKTQSESKTNENLKHYITILGIAQDAGYPQIDCDKMCCQLYYDRLEPKKMVSCIGLVDKTDDKKWLFDATPDIVEQAHILKSKHLDNGRLIDGVFLTHAHIGHYTGLMHFGRETLGGKNISVYAMPRMKRYLEQNGPWSQLVALKNIEIESIHADSTIILNEQLKVTPFLVPHRDELSETVGYKIQGIHKTALFIPDINKWQVWKRNIIDEVKKVDYAFLDASFFKDGEVSRPMHEIPHPFTYETVALFENETLDTKSKIYFIHFNHTNPTLLNTHRLKDSIQKLGFNFAKEGDNFEL